MNVVMAVVNLFAVDIIAVDAKLILNIVVINAFVVVISATRQQHIMYPSSVNQSSYYQR